MRWVLYRLIKNDQQSCVQVHPKLSVSYVTYPCHVGVVEAFLESITVRNSEDWSEGSIVYTI